MVFIEGEVGRRDVYTKSKVVVSTVFYKIKFGNIKTFRFFVDKFFSLGIFCEVQ